MAGKASNAKTLLPVSRLQNILTFAGGGFRSLRDRPPVSFSSQSFSPSESLLTQFTPK